MASVDQQSIGYDRFGAELRKSGYVSLTTGNVLDMYKSIGWELGLPPNARAPPPTVPSAPRSPAWSARPGSSPCSSSTKRSTCETTSWKTLLSDKAGAMRKIEPRSIRNNPENPSRIYVKDNSPGQTPSRARTHQCVHGLAPSATALIPDAKAARRHPLFPARQRIGGRCEYSNLSKII